ncbi:MAG: hypothetical protein COW76_19545 [Shewanella sp. CG18_big_fil_WC_8_21_14_2_50_42_11]|uniref:hypothetical protein n=1 Tax=Shewanella sp. CG18_big_fil_WC_8_21_14_2_50_42_11 TaxID=1975538 RepID=UPI000C5D947F|nr:hypothetical protein [Shewanella sp. CG18_big_fil_WC_8_21_14_2_50_42_11]PIP98713.1 MAG: hypothetical protein COW76_19545 [Shewanella sp. CG18_big_fil_WC_8_21_14_2_50_42_11]
MSKKLEKLNKQIAALEAQKQAEELALKNKNRIERLVARLVGKHVSLMTSNPPEVEKALDDAIAEVAIQFESKSQAAE